MCTKTTMRAAYENWTVRTGLKFQLTDAVSVLFRYSHTKQNDPTPVQTNSNTDTTIDPTTGKSWGTQTFTPAGLLHDQSESGEQRICRDYDTRHRYETMTIKADLGFANFTSLLAIPSKRSPRSRSISADSSPIFSQLGLPIDDYTDQSGIPTDLQTRSGACNGRRASTT